MYFSNKLYLSIYLSKLVGLKLKIKRMGQTHVHPCALNLSFTKVNILHEMKEKNK